MADLARQAARMICFYCHPSAAPMNHFSLSMLCRATAQQYHRGQELFLWKRGHSLCTPHAVEASTNKPTFDKETAVQTFPPTSDGAL